MPAKGTTTMVSSSWICSKLSSHSFCASLGLSLASELSRSLDIEGRESRSSSWLSEAAMSDITYESEVDMLSEGGEGRYAVGEVGGGMGELVT